MAKYVLFSDHEAALAKKDKEIERLGKRDGRAGIELCYDDGDNPFARSECRVVDFGVCDNQYVIENDLFNQALSEVKHWRDMCEKLSSSLSYFINGMPEDFMENFGVRIEAREALSAYNAMREAGK